MIGAVEAGEGLIGVLFVGAVLWDVFQTVVVPRPSPGRFRIARNLTRFSWRIVRALALRMGSSRRRDGMTGAFAPFMVLLLLVAWVLTLLVGFGLIDFALRDEIAPPPASISEAVYAAGTALFTIGFGDYVPTGTLARIVSLVAAGSGLGIVALVVTYLFMLYGGFQRREVQVVTLDARAGAPASGVNLLETYSRLGLVAELPELFATWETWAAEVLDSHVAYPILNYFRSSHDNESWVGSCGAVLDAATLVLTTIEGVPRGHAEMFTAMGEHLVEDVGHLFHFENQPGAGIARMEFEEARFRLAKAGYALADSDRAWPAFVARRGHYAARLKLLAAWILSPPSQWIGDRAPIGHDLEGDGSTDAGLAAFGGQPIALAGDQVAPAVALVVAPPPAARAGLHGPHDPSAHHAMVASPARPATVPVEESRPAS